MHWKTHEGTTGRLLQLCAGYFTFYVITGLTVKYFQGKSDLGLPGMHGYEFIVFSTLGGTGLALGVVLALRWYRMQSNEVTSFGPFWVPVEFRYIIPSGVFTAVVIVTTTLMYSLKGVSIMVAMVIMRGCVIVISRLVDAIQTRQGILKKRVYWQENAAVLFAICAVCTKMIFAKSVEGQTPMLRSTAALTILSSYVGAYCFRIYIMNYFKNTRGKGIKQDNKGFFAVEQISAAATMLIVAVLVFFSPSLFGVQSEGVEIYRNAITSWHPHGLGATIAGMAYGGVAFFSVFIFMFKGRTATFAGLVNRLTSLVAGTVSTLLFALFLDYKFDIHKYPKNEDWLALGFILVAVGFLTVAERKRAAELIVAHEIEPDDEE